MRQSRISGGVVERVFTHPYTLGDFREMRDWLKEQEKTLTFGIRWNGEEMDRIILSTPTER